LQGFAQAGQGFQRFGAVGGLAVNDLVVHPAELGRPLLVELPGALADGEIVIAMDEADGA
jgi:hypothetical protein